VFHNYQQLDEQSKILKTKATELLRRLIGIWQQLVTISSKMNTSTTTVTGAKFSEQDIVMAREA
jgi:hypothetical protein